MLGKSTTFDFPAQKKPISKKSETWRKKCIDGAEALSVWRDEGIRKSYQNKRINYDLYSDILDQSDVEKICNPFGTLGLNSPAKMQNYPICNPKIDLLVGESIKRKFDWKVRVLNDDAISSKEEDLKKKFSELLGQHLSEVNKDEKELQEDLKNFSKFSNYEYQDLRERRATQILQYLYKHHRMDYMFSKGFKDALISAEEIYQCDIVAGEPIVKKLNPLNVFTVRSGESAYIEDSDIITIVGYMSPGQIIDDYHDELTPKEIDRIESGMTTTSADNAIDIGNKPDLAIKLDEAIDISILQNDLAHGSPFDNNGNIKVTKVYWKSMRKMKRVKYYDEDGDEQLELRDENYKIDKSKGEEEEILWVSEWWEGHKIGGSSGASDADAIYVRMRPRPVQFRSMENPSKCSPGIVGTIYNTNDNEGVSLMDRMKPYQYLYNILAYNTELAIAKNYGKIMRLNLAEIPENWQIDQWMSFAQGMNLAVVDSFKEGNKGAAQGKLAGSMTQNSPVIDMEMGNTIQLYLGMMEFIKREMGEICGVSTARQGQIHQRQAVSNVEREVTQSSHITEYWFLEHDQVKIRVMETLLETAKIAWKDKKNKKVQHVLDDGSTTIFEIDGRQFNECEYGLQITDGADSYELMQSMKELAHAGIQNGLMNFSTLLDIYSTESLASIRRKIVRAEEEKMQREQEEAKRQLEAQREKLKAESEEKAAERAHEKEEWDREDARKEAELENKLEIERMRQDNVTSRYHEETPSNSESLASLKAQAEKINKDYKIKLKQVQETERHNKATENIKEKELKIKKQQTKTKSESKNK